MGSRKMTRKHRARCRENAEWGDSVKQWRREQKSKREKADMALTSFMRVTHDRVTRCALEEVFNGNRRGRDAGPNASLEMLTKAIHGATREYRAKLGELVITVAERTPELICPNYLGSCIGIAGEKYIRPVDEWRPRNKSTGKRFRSLVDHLLVKYPVPEFLYQIIDVNAAGWTSMPFFSSMAAGARLIDVFNGGELFVPMTRKMCHHFMQMPADRTFFKAVRAAQVRAMGGSRELERAIGATNLGRPEIRDEEFWLTVVSWFCNQSPMDPGDVGTFMDYIRHAKNEDPAFTMKGRNARALTRMMVEWHRQLANAKRLDGVKFTPCGIRGGNWEDSVMRGRNRNKTVWTIAEVLSTDDLLKEGSAMRHCVYSYAGDIDSGRSSIWSMKNGGERALTVEVFNGPKSIVQAKGKCNRAARKSELTFLKRWARENCLYMKI